MNIINQTHENSEHLAAVEIMRLENIIILQNKIDLVKEDNAIAQHNVIRKFVAGTVADKAPVIPISAQLGCVPCARERERRSFWCPPWCSFRCPLSVPRHLSHSLSLDPLFGFLPPPPSWVALGVRRLHTAFV